MLEAGRAHERQEEKHFSPWLNSDERRLEPSDLMVHPYTHTAGDSLVVLGRYPCAIMADLIIVQTASDVQEAIVGLQRICRVPAH